MSDQDQLVEQFMNVTGESRYLAEQYLQRNKNDVVNAIEDYYSNKTQTPKKSKVSSGVNTFKDLNNDEDESEDDKTNTNFFTGGEKSGLQVEDPNKKNKNRDQSIIDQIFQKAKEQMDQPDDRPSAAVEGGSSPRQFRGKGFKLGDSTEPSEVIEDQSASFVEKPAKVNREITFWKQGFTVGDGPLHRYDDPNNAHVLQELNQGRVPMSLLDVEFGQDVDVSVFRKTDEDWTPPKKKIGGFHGSGQRLGSPVPGDHVEEVSKPAVVIPSTDSGKVPEETGEGDISVNVRFANGKRVSFKFYSSDPITKVYDVVRNHPFTTAGKAFMLSHAFPVKQIDESSEITVEDAKLKNAVIVQRWI